VKWAIPTILLLGIGSVAQAQAQTQYTIPLWASTAPDPTTGLIPPYSDAYANWSQAGVNNIPFQGTIQGTILTVTQADSGSLGIGQTISGNGVAPGTMITDMAPDNGLTGAGDVGTYAVNIPQTVPSP
jgi:hypothetical protein